MTTPRSEDDEYSYPLHMMGTATTLEAEEENETIRRLHQVVFEVTGKAVEAMRRPRIGFLP